MASKSGKRISDAEFRRLWADLSITVAEIGERLGIGQTAVSSRARTRKLPPRPARNGVTPVCNPAVLTRLWLADVPILEIAGALGCDEKTVRNTRRRLGLPERGPGKRKTAVSLSDYRALQLRNALAARAREEQAALRNAEMVDGRQDARWPKGRAA